MVNFMTEYRIEVSEQPGSVAILTASYVLMDSWSTFTPLIREITQRGLDVIGMVKSTNQRYLVNGRKLSLKTLAFVMECNDSFLGIGYICDISERLLFNNIMLK